MLPFRRSSSRRLQLPLGMRHYASFSGMDDREVAALEQLAFHYGLYSDSYLVTEPNREYLWSSTGRAVVGFLRVGRFLHVAGSLLCHDDDKPGFLSEIVEFAKLNRLTISFFHIDEREVDLFRDQAFQPSRFGLESRISLGEHSWKGKRHEWVRRQANFVARQGVAFEEWQHNQSDISSSDWKRQFEELSEVAVDSLSGRAQSNEIPFFEGQLIQKHMARRRIFVARADNGAGRAEGFLLCTPMNSGRGWAFEMYRKRRDSVRGTVPFLFKNAVETLQQDGCSEVSLCPLPAVNCDDPLEGDSYSVRTSLKLWKRFGYALFDVNGLLHFKSRFRPEFREIYVCSFPRSGVRSTLAYMKAVGMMNISLPSLLGKLVRWSPKRMTLAAPAIATVKPVAAQDAVAADTRAA